MHIPHDIIPNDDDGLWTSQRKLTPIGTPNGQTQGALAVPDDEEAEDDDENLGVMYMKPQGDASVTPRN